MAKKTRQDAIRVSSGLFELGRKMMSSRGAETFSEYVRGLILLDAAKRLSASASTQGTRFAYADTACALRGLRSCTGHHRELKAPTGRLGGMGSRRAIQRSHPCHVAPCPFDRWTSI